MKKIILCLFVLLGLSACKIDLSIFGIGKVATESGTFNCSSDGTTQTGDCTQTYNINPNGSACDYDDPNDPSDSFDPNCTNRPVYLCHRQDGDRV